jgi:hypothetical protein
MAAFLSGQPAPNFELTHQWVRTARSRPPGPGSNQLAQGGSNRNHSSIIHRTRLVADPALGPPHGAISIARRPVEGHCGIGAPSAAFHARGQPSRARGHGFGGGARRSHSCLRRREARDRVGDDPHEAAERVATGVDVCFRDGPEDWGQVTGGDCLRV